MRKSLWLCILFLATAFFVPAKTSFAGEPMLTEGWGRFPDVAFMAVRENRILNNDKTQWTDIESIPSEVMSIDFWTWKSDCVIVNFCGILDVDEDILFNLRALVDGTPAAPGEVVITTVEVGHADGQFNRKSHCFTWFGTLGDQHTHNVTMQWRPTGAPTTSDIGIDERTLKIHYNKWGHNSCDTGGSDW